MSSDRAPDAEARGYEEPREGDAETTTAARVRIALNREIFRGLILAVGTTTIAMSKLGLPRAFVWSFAKLAARNTCRVLGVSVTVHGAELVEDEGPYVFTPNHQAHIDIAALIGHLPGPNRFAAKTELFDEPILGAVMRTLGMLPVDRDDPMKSIAILHRAMEQGSSIVIFPEGTRSRDGALLPFKKGAFVAAIEMGYPVVPVVLKGTRRVMPKGGYLSIHPGEIEIVIKPPIPTKGLSYEDRDRLRDSVRAIVAEEFAKPIGA